MIEGLQPYPEVAVRTADWLPALPRHWELHRAKTSFREVDERSVNGDEELLSVSHKTGVTPRSQKNVTMFMAESYEGHKTCQPGDIVVNTLWAWMAALGTSKHVGIVSPAYGVYRQRAAMFDPLYLDYLLRTETYRGEYLRSSRGITTSRLRLYPPDFLNIPFIQPPLDEQRLIVRFLDWHSAMTAKLIRAKRRLIALLNEQKQSIIHRAVTRGLDPAAKLKPSGVDWLGDVPEHWEVKRLKFACQVNPRTSAPSADIHVTFLPMENVGTTGQVDYSNQRPTADVSTGYTPFQQGDVILAKITPCFENGKGALLSDMPTAIGYGSTEFIVLRPMPGLLADYAYLLTVDPAFRLRGTEAMTGSAGQQRVSPDFVANWVIGVPPEAEQSAICAHVRDHTAEFDAAIRKVQSEIKFIQEFRIRLIADVVTGQLDVRDVAASLPEVAEAEIADDLTDGGELDDDAEDFIDEEEAA
ncbi:restriction endonuclease subunit S [Novosphingobium beihaiensis]|uniref:Restriction endonuclease subunit S n=1 Tax=Novosphingobium beihaiensis TaxID=2930389 RepID=A0ABT0BNP0_9SPHN|nr:restriction endonuclease subunit S [Novosphingobium beihaiensis]MCJ2186664.1 restriction endonuclease subunit S [Novosphingobium beihaiensis]